MPNHANQPLSEKSLGKQRALDTGGADDTGTPGAGPSSGLQIPPPARILTVRFTEGVPDLEISVAEKETVRDVKKKIRLERPTLQRRRLRLIHAGRLLTDGTYLYGWLATLEERQKRGTKSADGTLEDAAETKSSGPAWLHCSIGAEELEKVEEDATARPKDDEATGTTPLRGFDRLQTAGFSSEDIETIRRQFRISRGLDENPDTSLDDEDDEHARALEEQWIDDLDGAAGPVEGFDSSDDLYSTLLEGVIAGFFFNLVPFFFMRSSRPAAFFSDAYEQIEHVSSVVYSKRMQMALVIGLMVNLLIGVLRYVS